MEKLSEGLAAAARVRREELLDLAEGVASSTSVAVTRGPSAASVMLELEAPVGSFCFTEVVVTIAEVKVEGAPGGGEGWGCALGWDPEGALASALLDAEPTAAATSLAQRALAEEEEERQRVRQAVAGTRVAAE
ncbi:MAG: phosphonate C-P lyase system protein PhnG [Acidimicrobiales bacterium]|nr:phosphonate C-P lyase system protein PhnG [Acidimicrobiales bacterium]